MMGVSIVVPNYNGGKKIMACIKSIIELDYPETEVIVVDNGSTDGSLNEIIELFRISEVDNTIIANKENVGVAKATNQGFGVAHFDLVMTLDSDVILDKHCLKELVPVIEADEKIGIVVPKIFNKTTNRFQGPGFTISPVIMKTTLVGEGESEKYNDLYPIDYVPGAVVLSRKGIAVMDEDYFLYYSDAQYALDIRNEGYKVIYVPTARAWHDCNTAEGFDGLRMFHYMRSKLLFANKNGKHLNRFFAYLFFCYWPVRTLQYLFSGKFKLIWPMLKGTWEGCK